MYSRGDRVNRMMNIDREVEQSAAFKNAHELRSYPCGRLSMIDHIVAKHDVEALIRKRKLLTGRRDRPRTVLPTRKEMAITHRQWINADTVLRAEIKDQSMCAAADFNHASIVSNRPKPLEHVAYALCGSP